MARVARQSGNSVPSLKGLHTNGAFMLALLDVAKEAAEAAQLEFDLIIVVVF